MDSQGLDPGLAGLFRRGQSVELDQRFVMDCLSTYKRPDMKLRHLVKIGALVRVKRGLYVYGDQVARRPYSLEVLANKVYGPSYVSLEWALQYYRLIPERVVEITSVTTKRSAKFETPVGRFSYHHLPIRSYSVGIDLIGQSEYQNALLATKEKALCDTLVIRRGRVSSNRAMREILFEDLRIDPEDLIPLDTDRLHRIHEAHPHSAIRHFMEVVTEEQRQ